MAVTLEELFKSSPRREIPSSSSKKTRKIIRNKTLLEKLTKNGDISSRLAKDGKVKMRILVKKQDLKQMLETMDNDSNVIDPIIPTSSELSTKLSSRLLSSSLASIEKRMYHLVKKRENNQARQVQQTTSWRPVLYSIPEEVCLLKV